MFYDEQVVFFKIKVIFYENKISKMREIFATYMTSNIKQYKEEEKEEYQRIWAKDMKSQPAKKGIQILINK